MKLNDLEKWCADVENETFAVGGPKVFDRLGEAVLHIRTLLKRICKLETKLRMTEGAFKNSRIRELENWIAQHGRHSSSCYGLRNFERECDCGLYTIRQSLRQSLFDADSNNAPLD